MRWSWHSLSLRARLRLVTLIASSLALLVACSALFAFEVFYFRETVRRHMTLVARMVAANLTAAVSFREQAETEEILGALALNPLVLAAAVFQADGQLFAGCGPGLRTAQPPPSPGPDGVRFEGGDLILVQPIVLQNQRLGTLWFRYDYSARLRELGRLYAGIAIAVLLVSLGLAVFLAARLQQAIARPILALAKMARSVSEHKDYSIRAEKSGDDELSPFIDSFNHMLARIQEQDAALRRANDELESRVQARTQQLQQLEHQLELILNNAGDGIYGVDRGGRIVFANLAAAAFLRKDVREMIGQPAHELMQHAPLEGDMYAAEQCPLCAAAREGKALDSQDHRFSRGDRTPFHVELVSRPILEDGRAIGAVVVFRDVTERRNLERQLRQAQKMESVGQLAAGVAHDFNNILGIIQGYAGLLLGRRSWPEDVAEPLREISSASERAANLTRQLLAFSRKQVMQPRDADLGQIVANIIKMLRRILGEDITLLFNCSGTGLPIHADVGMIEQVVMNLAVNARDAMPRGGQLTITSCSEVIGKGHARNNPEARTGQFACLVVADTGCGMDMETLNRVFEPFFTTKDVGKGTGLGLATVYGIVKQHDGWVEVTSTPRKGTTFKVYLPTLAVAAEAEKKDARPVSVKGGQERLLLVEDEPALRKLASRVLQAYGYEVLAAADGLEALDEWSRQKGRIDLLVTDVVMPNGMSGKDLADRIRAHSPDLKVLYTSGYAFELSGLDLRQQSGCKFLPKPYLPSALAQAVRDCLSDELQEVRSEAELA